MCNAQCVPQCLPRTRVLARWVVMVRENIPASTMTGDRWTALLTGPLIQYVVEIGFTHSLIT